MKAFRNILSAAGGLGALHFSHAAVISVFPPSSATAPASAVGSASFASASAPAVATGSSATSPASVVGIPSGAAATAPVIAANVTTSALASVINTGASTTTDSSFTTSFASDTNGLYTTCLTLTFAMSSPPTGVPSAAPSAAPGTFTIGSGSSASPSLVRSSDSPLEDISRRAQDLPSFSHRITTLPTTSAHPEARPSDSCGSPGGASIVPWWGNTIFTTCLTLDPNATGSTATAPPIVTASVATSAIGSVFSTGVGATATGSALSAVVSSAPSVASAGIFPSTSEVGGSSALPSVIAASGSIGFASAVPSESAFGIASASGVPSAGI
ncbi:hypothetical protein FB451DRAFT_1191171 [Mycena latifolia]|nr:hypothetical protein FB451DRAFT_1191171 [Mycena latifolia]